LPGGEQLIPIEWTDWAEVKQYPEGVCFPVEKLLDLTAVVAEIEGEYKRSIMAEEEGDRSHDTGRGCELAGNTNREASADHHRTGRYTAAGSSSSRKSGGVR
jgi:hypothetical protein